MIFFLHLVGGHDRDARRLVLDPAAVRGAVTTTVASIVASCSAVGAESAGCCDRACEKRKRKHNRVLDDRARGRAEGLSTIEA